MSESGVALVADDSRVNRLVLSRLLASLGLEVLEADNGRVALELLRERPAEVDVVLLDVLMPELDGYETLAAIKSDEAIRHIPVIVVSGVEELDSVVRCIELGATDYLTKPINPAILGARIKAALAAKRVRDLEQEFIERQAATNEVLKVISASAFDLDTMLQAVVETAARLCHANHGAIYLLESGAFTIAASIGYENIVEYERTRPNKPGQDSIVGRAALTGRVAHIADVLADPEYALRDVQEQFGFRTLLAVPIIREGRIIGVVASARNEVRPFTEAEILLVTSFADQAGIGIENVRLLQTIERQKTELSRFLSPQVAALVSTEEGEQLLAGHRRQITAVFSDLRGFTSFAEAAEPEELFGVLRDYHRAMGELIVEHGGTLEHFAGDGILVFFNDPVLQADHVVRAVQMADAMRARFADLSVGWHKLGYELELGIGIATGYATLGRIGFEGRYDYGAIGNVVILASRLSSEARPNQILLSQRSFAAVEDVVAVEQVGELTLKGFTRPVPAVNVVGINSGQAVSSRT
jgi:class 3 adenylate cyclase/CheY-like chemotaxis protein